MVSVEISSDIAAFNAVLARYIALTGKLPADVVRRKAFGVGFQIYRALRLHQWGGDPRRKGIARAELDARVAQGRGIVVRPSIRRSMDDRRITLAQRRLRIRLRQDRGKARAKDAATLDRYRAERKNLWREAVRKELSVRERGIGYLARSFSAYRRFRTRAGDTSPLSATVTDRAGRTIGTISAGLDFARLDAEVRGLAMVAARYGILRTAIQAETRDTIEYLARRHREVFQQAKLTP